MPDGPGKRTLDEPLGWLGIDRTPAAAASRKRSALFPDGGYAKLVCDRAWCLLRLPGFRFRPSHCDVLHLDLCTGASTCCATAGAIPYNGEPETMRIFPATASHNTIAFDDRDQMPRLGPFLFGGWPDREELAFDPSPQRPRRLPRCLGATHRDRSS